MKPSRGECQALRARSEREVCNPQIHLLHLPQHLSHLEARKTDNDNAKQQKRKTKDNSNCSQPLACAQASHPVFKQAGRKAGSPLTRMEPSLSSIKQAPFFHCTIARLAAAHTFLMTEISRHALTDLSRPNPPKRAGRPRRSRSTSLTFRPVIAGINSLRITPSRTEYWLSISLQALAR